MSQRTAIVIPHFDHVDQFRSVLPRLAEQNLPLIIVDDASPERAYADLLSLIEKHAPHAIVARHEHNLGKGGAVATGLRTALSRGFTHALQIDADGQHDTGQISRFCVAAGEHPDALICGRPVFDKDISGLRYYARYITLAFSWIESISTQIEDAMCGFRMYPLAPTVALLDSGKLGRRMAFDPELLVRAVWANIPLRYLPIAVHYPEGGKSHFHYLRDNAEISWMHTRLIVGMLLRLPTLLQRKLSDRQPATPP